MGVDFPVLSGAGDPCSGSAGDLPGRLLGMDQSVLRGGEEREYERNPTIIPEDEFQGFQDELAEEVQLWREKDHMGYVSITCDLAKKLTLSAGTDREQVFTASQIKRILDLAK